MQNKPSILFITVDEMRKDSLSCYGNTVIKTPNLDALASRSLVFDRGYTVSPWCLPSRCSMLTGLYPHESGAYSNFRKCALDEGVPNFFNRLKAAGYATAHIGKCHFAPVPYSRTRPDATQPYDEFRDYYLRLGIDHLDLQDDKQVSVWFMDDYAKELQAAGYLEAYRAAVWNREYAKVFPFPGPAEWHPDAWVGRKAREYIQSGARISGPSDPVVAWVSFSGPHYTFDAPQEYLDRVDQKALEAEEPNLSEGEFDDPSRIHHCSYYGPCGKNGDWNGSRGTIDGAGPAPGKACRNYSADYWRRLKTAYYANVMQIDEEIGGVIEAARARWGENLLVIFTADHGEMLGNHGLWGKNNSAYEDVLNVPLLVSYPGGRTASGNAASGRVDAKVPLTDTTATMLQAAGLETAGLDGIDFAEDAARGGREYVFAEGEGFIAVTDGRRKYIQIDRPDASFVEFFDLESDPHEYRNRITDPRYASDIARLERQIVRFFMKSLMP